MPHRRTSLPWLLFVGLAISACGGDPGEDADAAPAPADARVPGDPDATPPPPDAGPASALLLGTWRELPSNFDGEPTPIEDRAVLTLAADGTYTLLQDGMTETAMFVADDGTITITGTSESGTHTLAVDYVATVDRLMLGALFPIGTPDGTIGTWHGDAVVDGASITLDLEFRADNTAHYARQRDAEPADVYDGMWSYVLDDVVFTTMIETTTVNVHFKEIPGVTIGGPFFERLPAARRAGEAPRGAARLDALFVAPLR